MRPVTRWVRRKVTAAAWQAERARGAARVLRHVWWTGGVLPRKLLGRSFLVSTKRGLFLLTDGGLVRLMSGEFYGLTRAGQDWYAFQKQGQLGSVIRFRLGSDRLSDKAVLKGELSGGCHQIDFIGGKLCLADTYNNAIMECQPSAVALNPGRRHFPAGELEQGRKSANYVHVNSIWRGAEGTFALFHNETAKTGKCSEIVALSSDFRILRRHATPARNGHNIVHYRNRPLYCNSDDGSVMWGSHAAFKCNWFTRGLSVTDSRILVGGSAYGSREARERLPGSIFVLDSEFRLLEQVQVPGMVQEIRCVSARDLSLSGATGSAAAARSSLSGASLQRGIPQAQ
jgi:hypothetical protein